MTEAQWFGNTDPEPMLEWLPDSASPRKLRHFAVAFAETWRTDTAVAIARQMYEIADTAISDFHDAARRHAGDKEPAGCRVAGDAFRDERLRLASKERRARAGRGLRDRARHRQKQKRDNGFHGIHPMRVCHSHQQSD